MQFDSTFKEKKYPSPLEIEYYPSIVIIQVVTVGGESKMII